MKISKLEGIKLLSELNMPTVKLLDIRQILEGKEPLKEGISVRLSPKSKLVKWNVGLPSINRRTNLDEIREEIIGLPGTDETQPYYPSSEFKKVKGTNLDNGLVIEDGDGNQYVWVEVPKNTTVYPTAGLNITDFTDDEYTKIENDLHTYTGVYRSETIYADTWVDDTDNEGWFSESEYYAHKKKMLKSVYQYGGFYVGRYEAGIAPEKEQARNYDASDSSVYSTLHETTQQIITKENAYPYNWVRRTQAKKLADLVVLL